MTFTGTYRDPADETAYTQGGLVRHNEEVDAERHQLKLLRELQAARAAQHGSNALPPQRQPIVVHTTPQPFAPAARGPILWHGATATTATAASAAPLGRIDPHPQFIPLRPPLPLPRSSSSSNKSPALHPTTTTNASSSPLSNRLVSSTLEQQPLRRGKWTKAEEAFAAATITYFCSGLLNLQFGSLLRGFLAQQLHCHPMRISKKLLPGTTFCGVEITRKLGRRAYSPRWCDSSIATQQKRDAEMHLRTLRTAFLASLDADDDDDDVEERPVGTKNSGTKSDTPPNNGPPLRSDTKQDAKTKCEIDIKVENDTKNIGTSKCIPNAPSRADRLRSDRQVSAAAAARSQQHASRPFVHHQSEMHQQQPVRWSAGTKRSRDEWQTENAAQQQQQQRTPVLAFRPPLQQQQQLYHKQPALRPLPPPQSSSSVVPPHWSNAPSYEEERSARSLDAARVIAYAPLPHGRSERMPPHAPSAFVQRPQLQQLPFYAHSQPPQQPQHRYERHSVNASKSSSSMTLFASSSSPPSSAAPVQQRAPLLPSLRQSLQRASATSYANQSCSVNYLPPPPPQQQQQQNRK